MTKVCRLCKVDLPLDSFGANRAMKDGLRYECRPCRRAEWIAMPKDHPIKERARARLRARPKPVRLRRGKLIHVTEDLQETACAKDVSGATYAVDEAPTCKRCLRVMLDALN